MKIITLVLFAGLLLAVNADLNSTEFDMTNVTIAENETTVVNETFVEETNSTEVIEVVDEELGNETDTISDVWSNETAIDN